MDAKYLKLEYGFWDGCTIYVLGTKNDMLSFFDIVDKYCDIEGKELLTHKLKRGYIEYEDVSELNRIFEEIKICFAKLEVSELKNLEQYKKNSSLNWKHKKVIAVFIKFITKGLRATEGLIWHLNNTEKEELTFFGMMKVSLTGIPYSDWIKELPKEFFDNMKDEDEPFWMWDVNDLKELVEKEKERDREERRAKRMARMRGSE